MKDILIVLLLIAIVILVFGAVNQDHHVDFNYIGGTWHGASVFALAGVGAVVTLLIGLAAAVAARLHVVGARRKLERELEQVYTRLRAAEAASPLAAAASQAAASPTGSATALGSLPSRTASSAEAADRQKTGEDAPRS